MFGTVDIKSRPLKLAYIVDPNNTRQVRDAIRLSSTLWGGDYFPIIPLHKRMPVTWRDKPFRTPLSKNVILGYIEAYDPDIFVQFSKSIPQYITDLGLEIIKPDEIWNILDKERNLSPKFGLGIFELLNEIFEQNFKFKMKYPVEIIFPKIPKQYALFWSSLFGEMPINVFTELKNHYFEPLDVKTPAFKIENLKEIMSGKVLFPRRITHYGISNNRRSGFKRDAYIYFMDATKTEDILDFWNLRAMGKTVIPVPKQLKEYQQLNELVIDFLKAHRRPWNHNQQVCDKASILRARNCTMEEVQDYVKTLQIEREPNDPSNDGFFVIQGTYPRVWDEWARDKDGAVPSDIYGEAADSIEITDTKELRIRLHSLLPKFAQKYGYHGKPRCANEISFRFYSSDDYIAEVFPKSSGNNFIRSISGLTSFRGAWRVGRNGLVKLVKDDFTETRDIPLSEKVFFAWLEDLGWKPKLSTSGLLAKQIYRKLDGYFGILRNEKLLGLLEHMNGGRVNKDCSPIKNNKITQEREITVGEIKSRFSNSSTRGNFHDYLIERGIFKIGLKIQCPQCSRHSWFALANVLDIFSCPRCLNNFSAPGNIDDSVWCYKTIGPFSVPDYADGAYTVLLTADFLNDRKMTTLRITPSLSFEAESPNKKKIEADIAAFWQESLFGEKRDGLLFGECKTYGVFQKKDFDRMRYIAKTFPGAMLIFSTLRKSLTTKEIAVISRIARAGRKYWKAERPINPVLILTGNELLNHLGPPYCWDESTKNKYDHINGILEVCDATQQIYLNMSSWHTEWHEKWERKRQHAKKITKK
jgi:hypothetical protein